MWHQASYRPPKAPWAQFPSFPRPPEAPWVQLCFQAELCSWLPLIAFFEARLLQSSCEQETSRPAIPSSFIQEVSSMYFVSGLVLKVMKNALKAFKISLGRQEMDIWTYNKMKTKHSFVNTCQNVCVRCLLL